MNNAAQVGTYPLSLVDYLFTSLAGRQVLSKLARQSVPPVCHNQHAKGLFRYTRVHFGVAAVPAIIQSTIELILSRLLHMCVYLDDLLMTGESDATHIHNLSAVQERLESAGIC